MDPLVFSVRVFDYLFIIFDKLAQGAWNKIGGRYIVVLVKEKTKSARCRRDIRRFFVLTLEFLRIGPQLDARRVALSTS